MSWLPSKETLEEIGVKDIITFYIDVNKFKNIREVEMALKEKFCNSIVSVSKSENKFYCTIFLLNPTIDEYKKKVLETFIDIYTLGLFADENKDSDLKYLVEKTNLALIKLLNEIGNLLENLKL